MLPIIRKDAAPSRFGVSQHAHLRYLLDGWLLNSLHDSLLDSLLVLCFSYEWHFLALFLYPRSKRTLCRGLEYYFHLLL